MTFFLYLANVLVASSATLNLGVADSPYQFLASGYGGFIDAFTVQGLQGYFAMDDVSHCTAKPCLGRAFCVLQAGFFRRASSAGLPDGASACKGQGQGQGQAAQALTVPALAWRFGLQSAPMAFP